MDRNYSLVQELMATVQWIGDLELELHDAQLSLLEDQEEIESYTDEMADCCDRINAIDEFMSDFEAGNIPAMADMASIASNMKEEREEEEAMLERLGELRACHEQQVQQMGEKMMTLQGEKLMLQKKNAQIWNTLSRSVVFDQAMRRLSERAVKTLS